MNTAIPYFYGAGVQLIMAFAGHGASRYSKHNFNTLLMDEAVSRPLQNGGFIPAGIPKGELIDCDLSPDAILRTASRDRDFVTVIAGVILLIVPIMLTIGGDPATLKLIFISAVVLTILVAVGIWFMRRCLANNGVRPGRILTNVVVGILIVINFAAGIYFLKQPTPNSDCPAVEVGALATIVLP